MEYPEGFTDDGCVMNTFYQDAEATDTFPRNDS